MGNFAEHSFYCIKCGNKGMPLMRKQGFKRERFHRKKLYCIHCKEEINHIECQTQDEIYKFKEDFENGVYINEAEESISFIRSSGLGKELLGQRENDFKRRVDFTR